MFSGAAILFLLLSKMQSPSYCYKVFMLNAAVCSKVTFSLSENPTSIFKLKIVTSSKDHFKISEQDSFKVDFKDQSVFNFRSVQITKDDLFFSSLTPGDAVFFWLNQTKNDYTPLNMKFVDTFLLPNPSKYIRPLSSTVSFDLFGRFYPSITETRQLFDVISDYSKLSTMQDRKAFLQESVLSRNTHIEKWAGWVASKEKN